MAKEKEHVVVKKEDLQKLVEDVFVKNKEEIMNSIRKAMFNVNDPQIRALVREEIKSWWEGDTSPRVNITDDLMKSYRHHQIWKTLEEGVKAGKETAPNK